MVRFQRYLTSLGIIDRSIQNALRSCDNPSESVAVSQVRNTLSLASSQCTGAKNDEMDDMGRRFIESLSSQLGRLSVGSVQSVQQYRTTLSGLYNNVRSEMARVGSL